jgi:hypothetical protein
MSALFSLSDINDTVNHEPRIQDVVLGERLGMAQPLNIRKTIQKNRDELQRYGPIHAANEMVKLGSGAKRSIEVNYLSEPQALLICMFSRTSKAADVRKALIEVFMKYRANREKPVIVKEHRRKMPARKLPDPCAFASNIPVADLLYSAQGHLNDALRTKNATKAEWHTKVAAGCVRAMLDNMSETGLHVLHRQLASQQETIKQTKGKA